MTSETKSIIALNEFKDCLESKREFGNDGFIFNGLITYDALRKKVVEVLDVYLIIGGYEPMVKLDINENGKKITDKIYHMDFNPKYYKDTIFKFDSSSKMLIIEGKSSPKIGDYKVEIKEM